MRTQAPASNAIQWGWSASQGQKKNYPGLPNNETLAAINKGEGRAIAAQNLLVDRAS